MKRIFALLIMALMVAILLPSCTENQRAKRSKYAFYFADDQRKSPMLGHFRLFSANQ